MQQNLDLVVPTGILLKLLQPAPPSGISASTTTQGKFPLSFLLRGAPIGNQRASSLVAQASFDDPPCYSTEPKAITLSRLRTPPSVWGHDLPIDLIGRAQ